MITLSIIKAFVIARKEASKMTIQKIRNRYWIIKNGQPKREATEREIKRFMILNLIDKLQTV